MKNRLLAAMAAYAVIAILATFTLDGGLRVVIWILMAFFALKSYIAHRAGWVEPPANRDGEEAERHEIK